MKELLRCSHGPRCMVESADGEWVEYSYLESAQVELAALRLQCGGMQMAMDEKDSELAALREELARLKEVTSFKDAVACVFDMLKTAACNTSGREWGDQLEELAEEVIEFAPEYKKQWKDICIVSASLTAAEQRNAEASNILNELRHDPRLWLMVSSDTALKIGEFLKVKPAESGASE